MNHRDCALAAMRGQPVDHIPFIARMDLWFNYHHNLGTLPQPYQHASLWDLQRDMGIGIMGFGAWDIPFYKLVHRDVDVTQSVDAARGGLTVTQYHTPYGTLNCRDVMAAELHEAAGSGARVEYPFKSEADYDALQFLIEHTAVVENFGAYGRFVDAIGGDGVALPQCGHLPAHQLMIKFMGYERFYLEWHDHPDRVEKLIAALAAQYTQVLQLATVCPIEAVEVGGNYDEHMTPPRVFDALFAPLYREARERLSARGKVLVVHGDGEMRVLLEKLRDCGVQVVEAFTPRPMTSIDVATTRRLWQGRVAMWGGVASTVLTDVYTDDEFEQYLQALFAAVAPGDRFILGFGDNVPTDALFGRIQRLVAFWREHGRFSVALSP
ncbi:MAG: uroporphyrinogen decarboxylase family protein [Chloroflexi bacterium]|nr:uroporphyrinogen decarboxylase family protein [Chloroflexota bacterium]